MHNTQHQHRSANQVVDQYVNVRIKLNKQTIMAGSLIEGSVFVHAIIDRPYFSLVMRIHAEERVLQISIPIGNMIWGSNKKYDHDIDNIQKFEQERLKKKRLSNTKQIIKYDHQFQLKKFGQFLEAGQYSIPFSLMLPANLPGSISLNTNQLQCQVCYKITATLTNKKGSSHCYNQNLPITILEKPHIQNRKNRLQKIIYSNLFCCYKDTGHIRFSIKSEQTCLAPGQQISLKGKIDLRDSHDEIKGVQIVLKRKIFLANKRRPVQCKNVQQKWVLWKGFHKIQPGTSQSFDLTLLIPQDIQCATTHGSLFSIYYTINFELSTGNIWVNQDDIPRIYLVLHKYQKAQQQNTTDSRKSLSRVVCKQRNHRLQNYPQQSKLIEMLPDLYQFQSKSTRRG